MKRFEKWTWSRGLGKFILYCGLCTLFISMSIYPGTNAHALQASPTETSQPSQTIIPTEVATQTPEPELEGQVGANAGLVCGAVILVIIIIAGLIRSARWMPYRGHDEEPEGD